ncbi:MAG TPA: hypothetical protein PK453_00975 [Leptospiraceae bacterium]|nr:hypothetical protein [Leptospiraceae bacterium]HNN04320.1 hypothetical protein [Leptospiraceae bacterium]HNO25813.1 hypothetical protein [Leptospiraceae bacterium]
MNSNDVIKLLQDFQKLRMDLLKPEKILSAGLQLKKIYSEVESEVRLLELEKRESELKSYHESIYTKYYKKKMSDQKIEKPDRRNYSEYERYIGLLETFYQRQEKDLQKYLQILKKIRSVPDAESIQILSDLLAEDLENIELLTELKLKQNVLILKQLTGKSDKESARKRKKIEDFLIKSLSSFKQMKETGIS